MIFSFLKSANQLMEKEGYTCIEDNDSIVEYQRYNKQFNFMHNVIIMHKKNGPALIQSYDPGLFDAKGIGNTCVGISRKELKILFKKMREKHWR